MADDFVVNVRQIGNYPAAVSVKPGDLFLVQQNGLGGPYASVTAPVIFSTALTLGGSVNLAPGASVAWNGASLSWNSGVFSFSEPVAAPSLSAPAIFLDGLPVATAADLADLAAVSSFNDRTGDVELTTDDILRAGGAPIWDAHFGGFITAPTPWDFRASSDQVATTAWVQLVIGQLICGGSLVTSFNGRGGPVTLTTDDVNAAYANYPIDGVIPAAPSPALGDASSRIATTLFVDESLADLYQQIIDFINSGGGVDLSGYAKLVSPNFSGVPTAPTAATANSSGQLATTAFVHNAVTAATAGVSSFNGRTGAVVLLTADVTGAGGAPIASPALTGVPQAPTPAPGDNSTKVATTAYVMAQIAAGAVTSFNTRAGAVTLSAADITAAGGALLASPAFTGTPAAPTAVAGTSTTQLATTAFVANAIATSTSGVTSFNGRTGAVTFIANDISAVGGALLASPTFTGTPAGPTAAPGNNSTQLATTAFVTAALGVAGGVTSFNRRTGAVTLSLADVTGAGGAPLGSPGLTGVPTAPTAPPGTNTNQIATTAFVLGQGGVTSFNTRTGAITLALADITAAGGAPLASPAFTGTPSGPTQPQTDSSTMLATTAFVHGAVNAAVTSFNGRTGAVSLIANDISAAGGALLAGPAFTGVPTAPTATAGTSTTQLATTAFVAAALTAAGGVTSFNTRAGAVTLTLADVTGAGGAPLASPAMTGTPTAPTAAAGTSNTQVATTAFVSAATVPHQNRNRIINGNFVVDQYNNGAATTPTSAGPYVCDRWGYSNSSQPSKLTFQQLLAAQSPLTGYEKITVASAYTSVAADYFVFFQKIEYANMADFGFGTASAVQVTLSFWVFASIAGTYSGSLVNNANNRSYVFTYAVSAANTWQQVVLTIPGDTAGTWAVAGNLTGLGLFFDLGSGSNYRTTINSAWTAGYFLGATGAGSLVTQVGSVMQFASVQLELGSAATPFDWRSSADTLAACQRYYETGTNIYWSSNTTSGGQYSTSVRFRAVKRAAPTVTMADIGSSSFPAGPPSQAGVTADGFLAYKVANATATAGAYDFSFTASAEL